MSVDGFQVSLANVELSTEPTEYVIDLREVTYDTVTGAFSWSSDVGEGVNFYVDDIHFSALPPMGDALPMQPAEDLTVLPLTVDSAWVASGYIGDGTTGQVNDGNCERRAGDARGRCHNFKWTKGANSRGWAGVMWQYPEGNFNDPARGFVVPAGAKTVRFYAWGAQGGEIVSFKAGNRIDPFEVELEAVTLNREPTLYVLDLANADYEKVVFGFTWSSDDPADVVEFFVDDIHYSSVAAPSGPSGAPRLEAVQLQKAELLPEATRCQVVV